MTAIIKGKIVKTLGTENAMGGTELIAQRMVDNIPFNILKDFHILHSRIDTDLMSDDPKRNILIFHDLPQDPMYSALHNENFRKKFAKFFAVSHWQKWQFINHFGFAPEDIVTIPNSIEPIPFIKKDKKTIRLIYHTTPHRGLNILVAVFNELCKKYDNLHLDVYSSFEIYGNKERDKQFAHIFKAIENNSKITNHGTVSNEKIRKALQKANIFAYPCTWPETSCLSLIEAMSGGCLCVIPDMSVLMETSGRLAEVYNFSEDVETHANIFYHYLDLIIDEYIKNDLTKVTTFNKNYIDLNHNNKSVYDNKWIPILTFLQNNI